MWKSSNIVQELLVLVGYKTWPDAPQGEEICNEAFVVRGKMDEELIDEVYSYREGRYRKKTFVLQPVLQGNNFKFPIGAREFFSKLQELKAREGCYNRKCYIVKQLQDRII